MKQSDTILVTGALGLAGSAVVDHLEAQGFSNVVGIGRSNCDLRDFNATAKLFEQVHPVYVFHAAARVYGIIGNMKHQGLAYLENTLINTAVIDASKQVGVKKIVVMGTNAIYAWPPKVTPIPESTIFDGRPHGSESAYAHAKRGMLAMLEAYGDSYGLDWVYLVSGNLYGPRDKFDPVNGHVLPSLIWKFDMAEKLGTSVELWGDGSPERDFLYSKDLARIVHITMANVSGAINIGNGTTWSIKQVVEKLSAISGVSPDRVKYDTNMPNGRMCCTLDLSRLRGLGFAPEYSLDRGLQETWDWYRENANAAEKRKDS
jgi:GDP-L-fucose synthase